MIFDLGNNDSDVATFVRNLRRARHLSRRIRMIVFTMNRPNAGPFNAAVKRVAAAEGVTVVDWHAVARRKRLLASDGVHARERGYRFRAGLIANQLTRGSRSRIDR